MYDRLPKIELSSAVLLSQGWPNGPGAFRTCANLLEKQTDRTKRNINSYKHEMRADILSHRSYSLALHASIPWPSWPCSHKIWLSNTHRHADILEVSTHDVDTRAALHELALPIPSALASVFNSTPLQASPLGHSSHLSAIKSTQSSLVPLLLV